MRDDERHEAELHFRQLKERKCGAADPVIELLDAIAEGNKQKQHGNTGNDLRIKNGQIGDVHHQ